MCSGVDSEQRTRRKKSESPVTPQESSAICVIEFVTLHVANPRSYTTSFERNHRLLNSHHTDVELLNAATRIGRENENSPVAERRGCFKFVELGTDVSIARPNQIARPLLQLGDHGCGQLLQRFGIIGLLES